MELTPELVAEEVGEFLFEVNRQAGYRLAEKKKFPGKIPGLW